MARVVKGSTVESNLKLNINATFVVEAGRSAVLNLHEWYDALMSSRVNNSTGVRKPVDELGLTYVLPNHALRKATADCGATCAHLAFKMSAKFDHPSSPAND